MLRSDGLGGLGWVRGVWASVAGLIVFLVFVPTVRFPFLPWDDVQILNANPWFRGDASSGLSWILTTRALGHWIPLTWASYALDWAIWGRNPIGYHLTNVVLHALNGGLFWLVARRLLMRALPQADSAALNVGAMGAALAFGIHPLRVESVAWVTERRDLLSGMFCLLAILAYLRAVEQAAGRRRRAPMAWAVVAYAASLLAKPIAMTLPAVLLILDAYPLRRFGASLPRHEGDSGADRPQGRNVIAAAVICEKVPFVVLGATGAALAAAGQAMDVGFTSLARVSIGARLGLLANSAVYYPLKTVLPTGLSPLHELPNRLDMLGGQLLASTVGATVLTMVAIALRRPAPWLAAAWAYSVITILPVSGVVHVSTILVADRYSYLSTLSWAVVLGGAGATLVHQGWSGPAVQMRRRALALIALAVATLGLATWGGLAQDYANAWRTPESLWRLAVVVDPDCAQCRGHLGVELAAAGRLAEAAHECALAVALRPDRADHHAFLASVLEREHRLDAAARSWEMAASLHPRYWLEARRVHRLARDTRQATPGSQGPLNSSKVTQ